MSESPHSFLTLPTRDDVVRVVQLTDTHLKGYSGGKLLGLDTDHSLQAIVDLVNAEYAGPDLLLATGDLADSGAREAYERLGGYFEQVTPHHYWLPGNHDSRDVMVEVAGESRLPGELRAGNWQILMLDSQVPREVGGHLGEAECARLEAALTAADGESLYSLVCLHHQPVPVGAAWLDEQMVADAAQFFDILGRFPRARGVLWGHVHQELDQQCDDLRLMCSPSTCVQFRPGESDFAVDAQAPGYRWLELSPAGAIRTGVSRATAEHFYVDREARGYL